MSNNLFFTLKSLLHFESLFFLFLFAYWVFRWKEALETLREMEAMDSVAVRERLSMQTFFSVALVNSMVWIGVVQVLFFYLRSPESVFVQYFVKFPCYLSLSLSLFLFSCFLSFGIDSRNFSRIVSRIVSQIGSRAFVCSL